MRRLLPLLLVACSNASNPILDAQLPPIDAGPSGGLASLVINEVAAGEAPDWFEVVNASSSPIQLENFSYVDVAGDFAKAKAFPAMTLAPGAYYAQDVDDSISGFKLGGGEALWVYRTADQRISDTVDWPEGAAPPGMTYRRSPDTHGDFATGNPSKGVANP